MVLLLLLILVVELELLQLLLALSRRPRELLVVDVQPRHARRVGRRDARRGRDAVAGVVVVDDAVAVGHEVPVEDMCNH